jgi:hypothetical protein
MKDIKLEDILITAIVLAYAEWSGSKCLCLNLTNHGRIVQSNLDIDLSRTIAWVGNYTNCVLDISEATTYIEALRAVSRQHEEIHGKEAYLSFLRFMNNDETVRKEIESLPRHQLEFNFIPRGASIYDQDFSDKNREGMQTRGFQPAFEDVGSNDGPIYANFQPFCKAYIESGKMVLYWAYSQSMYTEETMKYFIQMNFRMIRALVTELHRLSKMNISDVSLHMAIEAEKKIQIISTKTELEPTE